MTRSNSFLRLLVLFSIVLFAQSCTSSLDDPIVSEATHISGHWSVSSYQLNGSEQMGESLTNFTIVFNHQSASSGMSTWIWTDYNGSHDSSESFYTLSADARTVLMNGEEYSIEINGSFLELKQTDVSEFMILAERM